MVPFASAIGIVFCASSRYRGSSEGVFSPNASRCLRIVFVSPRAIGPVRQSGRPTFFILFTVPWSKGRSVFIAWPVLYFVAYTFLGVSRYFWYYAPLVTGFVVLFGFGVVAICRWVQIIYEKQNGIHVSRNQGEGNEGRQNLRLAGVLILLIFAFQVVDLSTATPFFDVRYKIYHAAGEWLNLNTSPEDAVGAMEVGIIGYYAHRPMIDFAGLVQPEIAELLSETSTYEDSAIWAINKYKPKYLVLVPGMYPKLESEIISRFCNLEEQLPKNQYGYLYDMNIYSCSID